MKWHAGCRVVLSPESLDDKVWVVDPPPLGTINTLVSVELMLDPGLAPYYKAVGLPMAGTQVCEARLGAGIAQLGICFHVTSLALNLVLTQ